jgi:ATP-dependent DNA helicase RecG
VIHLKVFVSSVQKELRPERIAIGSLLATDEFLRECTVPRSFEDYPQPLRPNPKAYLDLLRQCQIYLLVVGSEYGHDAGDGISATHEEYRLAQELQLPTLVCLKGDRKTNREPEVEKFLNEIKKDDHTYSRFTDDAELLKIVGERLCEHIKDTYATVPRQLQTEQSELTRQSASSYEREPITALTYSDLDVELARDMIAAAEEKDNEQIRPDDLPQLLLSRGYLWRDTTDTVLRPTVAGALLLAHKPGVVLTQARVQVDAFAGTERNADALDSDILDIPLPQIVEKTVAFIRRNTARPLIVKGLKRVKTEAYPQEVLREVVVNAIAHRDYAESGAKISIEVFADRLCISSPGLPPGGQSIECLAKGEPRSRSRNPLIVQGLAWLELMDERGSGIPRMTRLLEQYGHPKPVFRIDHDSLVVELRPSQAMSEADSGGRIQHEAPVAGEQEHMAKLNPRDDILQELRQSGSITTRRCVQKFGISRDTAWRILAKLVKEGEIVKEGSGRSTVYRLGGQLS